MSYFLWKEKGQLLLALEAKNNWPVTTFLSSTWLVRVAR